MSTFTESTVREGKRHISNVSLTIILFASCFLGLLAAFLAYDHVSAGLVTTIMLFLFFYAAIGKIV